MNELFELLKYTVPSVITGGVAAYFFKQYMIAESRSKNYDLLKEKKKISLPIKLQAYERMALFLERITISHLLNRTPPGQLNKIAYSKLLINTINAEFEHNLVQQIYISEVSWETILKTKNTILNIIAAETMSEHILSGNDLVKALKDTFNSGEQPTQIALLQLKQEVQKIL